MHHYQRRPSHRAYNSLSWFQIDCVAKRSYCSLLSCSWCQFFEEQFVWIAKISADEMVSVEEEVNGFRRAWSESSSDAAEDGACEWGIVCLGKRFLVQQLNWKESFLSSRNRFSPSFCMLFVFLFFVHEHMDIDPFFIPMTNIIRYFVIG